LRHCEHAKTSKVTTNTLVRSVRLYVATHLCCICALVVVSATARRTRTVSCRPAPHACRAARRRAHLYTHAQQRYALAARTRKHHHRLCDCTRQPPMVPRIVARGARKVTRQLASCSVYIECTIRAITRHALSPTPPQRVRLFARGTRRGSTQTGASARDCRAILLNF
jgi:hypothetical protein